MDALLSEDSLLEQVADLFEGRVGEPYDEKRHDALVQEAENRYAKNIPPGYLDQKSKSDDRRYGDVLIWYQLLDEAERRKLPAIFVTSEEKEDWWQKHKGRTIGPRPELRQEFELRTGEQFAMYSVDRFMQFANDYLDAEVPVSAIEEARERQEERERFSDLLRQAVEERRRERAAELGGTTTTTLPPALYPTGPSAGSSLLEALSPRPPKLPVAASSLYDMLTNSRLRNWRGILKE